MDVTATEAKNRLGQMLEACQREPVVIEKSGRRHSVLLSAAHYDALVAKSAANGDPGAAFYERYKDWIDHTNAEVERAGLWNAGLRVW
jgi:prevent-host-death family protein